MSEQFDLEEILMNAPIAFGLVAQGKIPLIEEMLGKRKPLSEIAVVVGWEQEVMTVHYIAYLQNKIAQLREKKAKPLEWEDLCGENLTADSPCGGFTIVKAQTGLYLTSRVAKTTKHESVQAAQAHAEELHQQAFREIQEKWGKK